MNGQYLKLFNWANNEWTIIETIYLGKQWMGNIWNYLTGQTMNGKYLKLFK